MHRLALVAEAIAGTTKKLEKVRLLADYLRSRSLEEAATSAIFLSGRAFSAREETTLQIGGALLWQALKELTGKPDSALRAAYRRHGDLGAAAFDLLLPVAARESRLNVLDVARSFREIAAARGPAAKAALLQALLAQATALEAKYLIKIISGDLRIGLKESLVEEAIAAAFDAQLPAVLRANMLLGDIAETLRLAASGRLEQARMRLFHPLGFMLASPAENAEEAFEYFHDAAVEDKYDGIRAQAHVAGTATPGSDVSPPEAEVKLFSRTLDEITASFPDLVGPLSGFSDDVVLDGEIVAWRDGRALAFSELQQRLGRKRVSEKMMREVPVCYVVFDVLYAAGELVIDRPLRERQAILDGIFASRRPVAYQRPRGSQGRLEFESAAAQEDSIHAAVLRAPVQRASSPEHLGELFDAAQARGNEGLMIKDLGSVYTPGRRGRSWLKLKRELATLDVVVTAVEFGHGKRAGVLSDYTFAVRNDGAADSSGAAPVLLNVGKAYSGLTDAEIAEMTQWFLAHTMADHGFWREVEPTIVLEVAFNNVMISDRHSSGYALRFPRIVRLRRDKPATEIDTLSRVREIFDRQQRSSARSEPEETS